MTLQHDDEAAVDRFTAEVEQALVRGAVGKQEITLRLIATWIVAGALLTLAVLTDDALSTILYVLGIAVVVLAFSGPLHGAAQSSRAG
jgi:hypothetical protein